MSQAERARLRSGLDEQVTRFVRAFDNEIRENCTMLLPDARQLREQGRGEAHRMRYEQWASSHDRTLFARIGFAALDEGKLNLYTLDRDGHSEVTEWPPKWQSLRDTITARIKGAGPPPSNPPDSTLIQSPVFDDSPHHGGGGPELEWMIFELSDDAIRKEALPRLVAEYINPGGEAVYDASVSWLGSRGPIIFSTRADHSSVTSSALNGGVLLRR